MAILLSFLLPDDLGHHQGGLVYCKHGQQTIARSFATSAPYRSSKSMMTGNIVYDLAKIWPTLSRDERGSWFSASASENFCLPYGAIIRLPAHQFFMSCNARRALLGLPVLREFDFLHAYMDVIGLSLTPSPSGIVMTWSAPKLSGAYLFCRYQGPLSPGRSIDISRMKESFIVPSNNPNYTIPASRPGMYAVIVTAVDALSGLHWEYKTAKTIKP